MITEEQLKAAIRHGLIWYCLFWVALVSLGTLAHVLIAVIW